MEYKGKKYDNINTEEQLINFWNEHNIFQKSINNNKNNKSFVFYDGPPFATGLPHYGHVIGSFIKDTIGRWATINGYHVPRRAGWDTHGLPIEYEIEKKLGIKTKDQVKEFGIGNYNEACREIVMTYAKEWKVIMNRLGRWVDFDDDYKTMDVEFMSKVWTVFSKIYEKDLIYEGVKIMPYSIACTTPLSNFEATSNYQNVSDRTAIVKFRIKNKFNKYFLSWTTTPWTLPAHYCLCVNKNLIYVSIEIDGTLYIIAKDRINFLTEKLKLENITIIKEFMGSELIGLEYTPPFNYVNIDYKVVADDFVTNDSGTGIVHIAPAYGEDDYRVCIENKLITKELSSLYIHIDDSGYGINCGFLTGMNIKDMTTNVLNNLKSVDLVLLIFDYYHNYPFCWRSDTPLIYKAVKCWFLKVESIKDRMVEINKGVNWVPEHIGRTRFNNWLENTRDWCLSRNRYWGTPIPIWRSDDGEIIVVKSREHLEQLTNQKITDLHRHHIDHLIITKDGKDFKRTETVLDCWFESGSVPFASPTAGYPANFIAEGVDQTRGWFYTLLVIGTILEDRSPYQNVIVNGLVLASDGKKMSKRLKNYPDPIEVVNQYGADSLRYYLIMSGASMGAELRFNNSEVKEVLQTVVLPLTNSMSFYEEYYNLYSKTELFEEIESDQPFDKWILKKTYDFIQKYKHYLNKYEINPISDLLIKYINDLNNNYIRLNRNIIKGRSEDDAKIKSQKGLSTLKKVLNILSTYLSPILPFLSEKIYQYINQDKIIESVHLLNINSIDIEKYNIEDDDIKMIDYMLKVIDMVRKIRNANDIQLKKPLRHMIINCENNVKELLLKSENYILTEGNILEIEFNNWEATKYEYKYVINLKTCGVMFKNKRKDFEDFMSEQNQEILEKMYNADLIKFNNCLINDTYVKIYQIILENQEVGIKIEEDFHHKLRIKLNIEMDETTSELYISKNIAAGFQRVRKIGGFHVYDNLTLVMKSNIHDSIILKHMDYIMKTTRCPIKIVNEDVQHYDYYKLMEINNIEYHMYLIKKSD